jgi:hypothetical protein
MYIVTQNQQTVQCGVLTDSGQNLEDRSVHIDPDLTEVQCEVLTDGRQSVEDIIGHIDTETKDGTLRGTDRHWRDSIREQWAY